MIHIRHAMFLICTILLLTAGTAATNSGGFELRAEQPTAQNATLVVWAFGCHKPEEAKISGTAEGIVDGVRRSIPLTLVSSAKGVYDVSWERPLEGDWVFAFTGVYLGNVSSLIVEIDGQGQAVLPEADRYGRRVQPLRREITAADVNLALQKLTHAG